MPQQNEHVSNAVDWLDAGDDQPSAFAISVAQVEATLAVAAEQARTADALETANLIGYMAFLNGSNGIDGYHPNAEQLTAVRDQIETRLGLA